MPVALNVGDVLTSRAQCRLENQIGVNVRWWRVTTIVSGAPTLEGVADDMSTIFAPLYKQWLGTSAEFESWMMQRQSIPFSVAYITSADAGPGTAGLSGVPAQVSGCLTLLTNFGGRRNRGRSYIPFPGNNMVDPPYGLSGAGVTALAALGTDYSSPQTVGSAGNQAQLQPAIYAFPPITLRDDIVTFRANDKLATQRRRGAYGRPN
jgi:hypothetical protein